MNQPQKQYRNPWESKTLGETLLWFFYKPFAPIGIKKKMGLELKKTTLHIRRKELEKFNILVKNPHGSLVVNALAPLQYTNEIFSLTPDNKCLKNSEASTFRLQSEKVLRNQESFEALKNKVLDAFPTLSVRNVLLTLYILAMQEKITEKELKNDLIVRKLFFWH